MKLLIKTMDFLNHRELGPKQQFWGEYGELTHSKAIVKCLEIDWCKPNRRHFCQIWYHIYTNQFLRAPLPILTHAYVYPGHDTSFPRKGWFQGRCRIALVFPQKELVGRRKLMEEMTEVNARANKYQRISLFRTVLACFLSLTQ